MGFYSHLSKEERIKSYDFIETFIAKSVVDWKRWNIDFGTDDVEKLFSQELVGMSDSDFEFLLLHCGYIPDYYGKDSSEETLYSKLVESMVCEWARRVGFTDSFLQKQKSNKEDITLVKDGKVIVCDAKSFRLGRSQSAPNVKDTIKKEAYTTWLSAYDEQNRIGGLTTFPSMHNWKKGGAAYQYYTEGNPPIMILFYEQMAYILNEHISADSIIGFLDRYDEIFPESSKIQDVYWTGLFKYLFVNTETYTQFAKEAEYYTREKASHTLSVIQSKIDNIEKDVDSMLSDMSIEELQRIARMSLIESRSRELKEQEKHILDFRPLLIEKEEESLLLF